MSYDLMVFDPNIPPKDRAGFMKWFSDQTQWKEDHGYNNPEIPSANLRSLFLDLIKTYPPMNGPLASDDVDDPKVTDYSLGRFVIYAAFAWSEADEARKLFVNLARKHNVGFFDVSTDDGEITF